MNDLSVFYYSLATVALIIILGFALGKFKAISEHTNKQLVNILLMVAMPCALFSAFPQEFDESSLSNLLYGLIGGVLVFLALIILSKLLFNKKLFEKELSYESQFAFVFNNATFLGYPLVSTFFGPEALIPYCGFIIVFNLALFSYGVFLFERKVTAKLIRMTLLNPNIIAVLLGAVFFIFSLKLPDFLNSSIDYVGQVMTPLSLICIGYMLSRAKLKALWQKKKLFITALLQLTLGPSITFIILYFLGIPEEVRNILVLIQALPTATSLGLFAEKYGGNPTEASELVAISTILSIITLPLAIMLFIL